MKKNVRLIALCISISLILIQGNNLYSQFYITPEGFMETSMRQHLKEAFGMNDSQISSLTPVILQYKASIESYNDTVMPDMLRISKKKEAKDIRNSQISQILDSGKLDEICRYLDVRDEEEFIRTHFPIYSNDLIKIVAPLHLDYVTGKRSLLNSGMSDEVIKKEVGNLYRNFKKNLKEIMSPAEYDAWGEYTSIYLDNRLVRYYQLSASQQPVYKDIMNERAIDNLLIKRSSLEEAQKARKRDSVFSSTYEKLGSVLSEQQLKAWYEDNKAK